MSGYNVHAMEQGMIGYHNNDRISIYSDEQIDRSTIKIKNYQMKQGDKIVNAPKAEKPLIYVWTAEEKIIIAEKEGKDEDSIIKHSSLACYKPVKAAGDLCVDNGKVTLVSNASGHYKPSWRNLYNFINHLEKYNLLSADAKVIYTSSINVIDSTTMSKAITLAEFKAKAENQEYESQGYERYKGNHALAAEKSTESRNDLFFNPRLAKRKTLRDLTQEEKSQTQCDYGSEDDIFVKRSSSKKEEEKSNHLSSYSIKKPRPQYHYDSNDESDQYYTLFSESAFLGYNSPKPQQTSYSSSSAHHPYDRESKSDDKGSIRSFYGRLEEKISSDQSKSSSNKPSI